VLVSVGMQGNLPFFCLENNIQNTSFENKILIKLVQFQFNTSSLVSFRDLEILVWSGDKLITLSISHQKNLSELVLSFVKAPKPLFMSVVM
jgi:hypothetical protein